MWDNEKALRAPWGPRRREISPHQANQRNSESINICITIPGSRLSVTGTEPSCCSCWSQTESEVVSAPWTECGCSIYRRSSNLLLLIDYWNEGLLSLRFLKFGPNSPHKVLWAGVPIVSGQISWPPSQFAQLYLKSQVPKVCITPHKLLQRE